MEAGLEGLFEGELMRGIDVGEKGGELGCKLLLQAFLAASVLKKYRHVPRNNR